MSAEHNGPRTDRTSAELNRQAREDAPTPPADDPGATLAPDEEGPDAPPASQRFGDYELLGELGGLVDYEIHVPSHNIEQVEDIHLMLEHLIVTVLRERVRVLTR